MRKKNMEMVPVLNALGPGESSRVNRQSIEECIEGSGHVQNTRTNPSSPILAPLSGSRQTRNYSGASQSENQGSMNDLIVPQLVGIGNDLAPRALEYLREVSSPGYKGAMRNNVMDPNVAPPFVQPGMGSSMLSLPLPPNDIRMMAPDSDRNLVRKQQAGTASVGPLGIKALDQPPEHEDNGCFYSCCPVECCRCPSLAKSCGGCCSSSPTMPGGGCCGCLGLSPSVSFNIPPPGVKMSSQDEYIRNSSNGGCCNKCCPGHGNGCCSFWPCCVLAPSTSLSNIGPLSPDTIYKSPSWLPMMGSE